jgi:hypothetical protein
VADIEKAADAIVWCCDEAPGFTPARPQDRAIVGNIIESIDAYGSGKLGEPPIPLSAVDRIIAIGSDGMMAAVAKARHGVLAKHLKAHKAIGSISSPMRWIVALTFLPQCSSFVLWDKGGAPLCLIMTRLSSVFHLHVTEPFGHLTRPLAGPNYTVNDVTEPFGQGCDGGEQCADIVSRQNWRIQKRWRESGWTFQPAQTPIHGEPS